MRTSLLLLALVLSGCGGTYRSELLQLELKPPAGSRLLAEDRGPPPRARFEGGLELLQLGPLAEAPLEQRAEEALVATGLKAPPKLTSSREGTLGGAKALRYELKGDGRRALLYLLPRAQRTVVIYFSSDEAGYGRRETQVERALGTLVLRD